MKELIEKAKKGNKEAYAEIFRLCYSSVYRYVLLRVGNKDETDDVVSDVFLKTFMSLDRYDHKKSTSNTMLPYLFTIARNAIIDLKKKSKDIIVDDEILFNYAGVTELPTNALEKKEWATWLYKALTELSELEREVLELKFLSDLSTEEVGQILNKEVDAIRQLQSRGIKKLRDILKRDQKKFPLETK